MAEPITIILQTWARTEYALRTIAAAKEYLHYPNLIWYVADDGSPPEHVQAVVQAIGAAPLLGVHSERRGYGANANAAWDRALYHSTLSFWLEDDWCLSRPLDLYPYAALLMEDETIGMVRLGTLNPGMQGHTMVHNHHLYWVLDRVPHHEGTPVFTGHPSLRHQRYFSAYGWYPEGLKPGETELAYAYKFRHVLSKDGPAIAWPADYPPQGYFGHIGQRKTEDML